MSEDKDRGELAAWAGEKPPVPRHPSPAPAIPLTSRAKGSFLIRSSVVFWYRLISRRATVPGRMRGLRARGMPVALPTPPTRSLLTSPDLTGAVVFVRTMITLSQGGSQIQIYIKKRE